MCRSSLLFFLPLTEDANFTRPLVPFSCTDPKTGANICGPGTKRTPKESCAIDARVVKKGYTWVWNHDGRRRKLLQRLAEELPLESQRRILRMKDETHAGSAEAADYIHQSSHTDVPANSSRKTRRSLRAPRNQAELTSSVAVALNDMSEMELIRNPELANKLIEIDEYESAVWSMHAL